MLVGNESPKHKLKTRDLGEVFAEADEEPFLVSSCHLFGFRKYLKTVLINDVNMINRTEIQLLQAKGLEKLAKNRHCQEQKRGKSIIEGGF